jgi:hypothetical protein
MQRRDRAPLRPGSCAADQIDGGVGQCDESSYRAPRMSSRRCQASTGLLDCVRGQILVAHCRQALPATAAFIEQGLEASG